MTRRTYDLLSWASFYDLLSASERPWRERGLALLDGQPGERVLEIGCGTGQSLAWLAQRGCRAVGLDLSPGMLRAARARLAARPAAGPRPALLRADAQSLPLAGGSLDAVFLSFTLELFPPPILEQVLAGCQRTLKPGGRLVCVSLHRPPTSTRAVAIYDWFHRRLPALVDCTPIQAAGCLRSAGFQIRREETGQLWGLPVAITLAVVLPG